MIKSQPSSDVGLWMVTDYRGDCCHGEHLFGALPNFSFHGEPTRSEDGTERLTQLQGLRNKGQRPRHWKCLFKPSDTPRTETLYSAFLRTLDLLVTPRSRQFPWGKLGSAMAGADFISLPGAHCLWLWPRPVPCVSGC